MSGFLMMISALDGPARGTRQRLRAGPFAPPPSLPRIGRCRIAWRWPLTCQPVVLLLVGQCIAAVVDVVDEGVLLWVPAIATPAPPATSADARAPVTINRRTLAPPTSAMGTSPYPAGRVSARAEYTMAG